MNAYNIHRCLVSSSSLQPAALILDLSRLIYAAWKRTPSGIPRVELAYAEHFITTDSGRLKFAVLDSIGRLRIIDEATAKAFVADIARYWRQDVASHATYLRIVFRAIYIYAVLLIRPGRSLPRWINRHHGRSIYIIPSQLHMEHAALIEHVKRAGDVKLVYFVHDIIPSIFPEYFPPNAERRNRLRMEAAMQLADTIIVNSRATAETLRQRYGNATSGPPVIVAPLGVDPALCRRQLTASPGVPYFVMIGTIEPRKNHLLVLNIWRELRKVLGDDTPKLILVGGRGWENENVIDMLERSPVLGDCVEERSRLSDQGVAELLMGARALLLPSFAEGYGLPLAEALTLGVPALCSDIPVFREVGGAIPEFFGPIDGQAWMSAIRDYSRHDSPRRLSQLKRLMDWETPRWDRHFAIVSTMLTTLEGE